MTGFRIEKRAVEAAIYTIERQVLRGTVHMWPRVRNSRASTPERIPDLADEATPFLPFHGADGVFVLVGKSCIAAVHINEPLEDDPGFWRRVPAQVLTAGGHQINGAILAESGPMMRLSDELNGPEAWLRVERERGITWVRKAHVVTATVEEEAAQGGIGQGNRI